ncbi:MAG: hypothetical protein U9N56_10880 [Actinomycetota bacterium]|nr:hypothetical protein [Actinomycetota bacterium]
MSPLDLILPTTDGGVFAQLAAAVVLFVAALWFFRSNREARFLTVGVGLVVLGLMGLRALH